MYGREKRVLLREYLDQGLTKTEIARKLGVHRRTLHRWIQEKQLDTALDDAAVHYRKRPAVARKIDDYREIIRCRLEAFPELSAVRLFEEIRAAGYAGGYTQVKDYVRSVRPRPPADPVQRFETPPGHQAQVDFAEFKLPWGTRWALLVVLGYSRLLWLRFSERQDMRTLFRGLESAFAFFGGVPHEILFDQMRAAVISDQRTEGGPLIENPELCRFAAHWQFRPRACRPYRAQTKGKVERPIRYLRSNFFYGRAFVSDADLNDQAQMWLEGVANVRRHRTLGERPIDRFERERKHLQSLAAKPYQRVGPWPSKAPTKPSPRVPAVSVERRSLDVYTQLVESGR